MAQTQPGGLAGAHLVGGKEAVEDVLHILPGQPGRVIGKAETTVSSCRYRRMDIRF
jgi:hypothetical protein